MDQLKPSSANSTPLTPLGFLDRAATVYGDCPSVVYGGTTYTWTQTHRRCLQLASSIESLLGIERGYVVSVVSPNVPAMYELHFAVPMAGAVLNCINLRLDARTVSVLLIHSESKLVFVDSQYSSLLLHALSLFPPSAPRPLLVLILDDDDDDDAGDGRGTDRSSPDPDFYCTYKSMVDRGDPSYAWIRPRSEWDPMVLNYTSGTTLAPKGAVHCHRGIFAVVLGSLVDWAVPEQPVYLWTLPMFHANGWCFPWAIAAVGGTNVCLRRFTGDTLYDIVRRGGITHMCCAPVVLNMLSNSPTAKDYPLERPVQIFTAGAPPPPAVIRSTEALGFVVSHGYGLTEAAGLVVTCAWKPQWNGLPPSDRTRMKARQGVRTAVQAEADVVDPDTGRSVARDGSTLGEIVLRGPSIMLGYLKDPECTAKCLKEDGWFYTGDVGVMHPDAYIEIKDRSKDVIISGGENISSIEVEAVLYAHPAVNEAAVVARPDQFWGETPCSFVSLKGSAAAPVTEKEMIEYCRAKMPHYMVPKTVVFKEELPKTATGKIQKFILRDLATRLGSPSKANGP